MSITENPTAVFPVLFLGAVLVISLLVAGGVKISSKPIVGALAVAAVTGLFAAGGLFKDTFSAS